MERTTRKHIDNKFNQLKELVNNDPLYNGTNGTLFVEYASVYGGYRLVNIINTAHHGAFGESSMQPRMKANEFYAYLCALIAGIEYERNRTK